MGEELVQSISWLDNAEIPVAGLLICQTILRNGCEILTVRHG